MPDFFLDVRYLTAQERVTRFFGIACDGARNLFVHTSDLRCPARASKCACASRGVGGSGGRRVACKAKYEGIFAARASACSAASAASIHASRPDVCGRGDF